MDCNTAVACSVTSIVEYCSTLHKYCLSQWRSQGFGLVEASAGLTRGGGGGGRGGAGGGEGEGRGGGGGGRRSVYATGPACGLNWLQVRSQFCFTHTLGGGGGGGGACPGYATAVLVQLYFQKASQYTYTV